ncbi:MAG: diaminopimelate decarboxylase [Oscillospiraceae bacterium]|nr:diaminopimelate decarboxylase [Oscillospiraceae bacterium]
MLSDCLGLSPEGHLTIGGCDTPELAVRYGTPLYVVDETLLRKNCADYVRSIADYFDGNGQVLFACKALCCKEVLRVAADEGVAFDCCSSGEIYTAIAAGVAAEKIFFHGNNKTKDEISYAVAVGVGCFMIDNLQELQNINEEAKKQEKTVKAILRIKPGIDAHTHEFIKTGQIDSKFGFALETGEAMAATEAALQWEHIALCGVHCHIGSQIFDAAPFVLAAERLMDFMIEARERFGVSMTMLDLGGGYGIRYTEDDHHLPYTQYLEGVAQAVKAKARQHDFAVPSILIEPGRSIPGAAGITLYEVGTVKHIPHIRDYVIVDGGMVDNPRYIMYGAKYTVVCANKAGEPATETVTVAGRCCESGDLIQEHTKLQPVSGGDILAVLSTGAYNYSMSSNYNRMPRPPMVMTKNGAARVIVRGETIEELCRNDI